MSGLRHPHADRVRRAAERAASELGSRGLRTLVGAPGRTLAELQQLARDRPRD